MNDEKKLEEAQALVARLVELEAEVTGIVGGFKKKEDFARRFLSFSHNTWTQLKAGTYYDGRIWSKSDDMRECISDIEGRLPQLRAAKAYEKTFLETAFVKAAKGRVSRARDDADGRRIVVCLAPTGYGKTAVANYFVSKGAVKVEGSQSWKSSYRSFCSAIATACGTPVPVGAKQDRAEEAMLKALSTRDGTLVIDEANTLSGPCANGIKEIVNRTGWTVVLLAIPEFWDSFLEGNQGEVRQVINRCQRVIRQETILTEDVKLFLKRQGLPEAFASDVTAEANYFGGFRTVNSLIDEIKGDPTKDSLDKAVRRFRQNVAAFNLKK